MIARIERQLSDALIMLKASGLVPAEIEPRIRVSVTRDLEHADFASNLAMILAGPCGCAPHVMAQALIDAMPESGWIKKVVIDGPGFINFYLIDNAQSVIVAQVLEQGKQFGRSSEGAGRGVHLEVVSAEPDGQLLAEHQRAAVVGDTVCRLLEATGFSAMQAKKDATTALADGRGKRVAIDKARIDSMAQGGDGQVLYLFGADRHGNAARLAASCEALGYPREKLQWRLIQSATFHRQGPREPISAHRSLSLTTRQLYDEVGTDAVRFFYVMRNYCQPLRFDLELAKSQRLDNPVYCVQYAHACVCSVMRQLQQRSLTFDQVSGLAASGRLIDDAEIVLMKQLTGFPALLRCAALAHEPHQLTRYLRDLANSLNSYYCTDKVLVADAETRHARVCLLLAVRQVLSNGLSIIGVSTPEVM